ncbi:MAG: fumarate hydratase [Clostridiales bacterium]|nr:fumarate hydratase [Clostridiales bacterium]MDU1042626.1 fumarate hydratase [Clostridiales bacterium]MDU3490539.1 fumarate hydratase [Clostridiales bacterium]
MREISLIEVTKNIREMCIEANYFLEEDVKKALNRACKTESSPIGISVLEQLEENLEISEKEMIPICQDTGMAVIFLEIGQDVHLVDGDLSEAVNEGVRQGYEEGFLRKSVVNDPLERVNTGDNTPAIIHTEIVPGDKVKISLSPKGFGSENMSRIFMLKPADGLEGVKKSVLRAVEEAGPNACPPFVVGVGIGGDFEKAAILSKKALMRELSTGYESTYRQDYVDDLEEELLKEANELGLGPAGLGGKNTVLAVNIETYPTHIAGLPVAVNICCHVDRHKSRII